MDISVFRDFLLAYNRKVNLVSRQSTPAMLDVLIAESLLLKRHIFGEVVVDAGSGGGLLGIPLAMALPQKRFILVETIQKKAVFLNEALRHLGLANAGVWQGPIQEYMQRHGRSACTIISRGFPRIEVLADLVVKGRARELVLISSANKIGKIAGQVAKLRQNSYNIPSRDNLVIYKLENVSRETLEP